MGKILSFIILCILVILVGCKNREANKETKAIFLHHSTGQLIWDGDKSNFLSHAASKISFTLGKKLERKAQIPRLIDKYNKKNDNNLRIEEMNFPKEYPYGWNNFPYDYYNIWVVHAGDSSYLSEPTLETLTKQYELIIFKHCFPVSNILSDKSDTTVAQSTKTINNYKMQYNALMEKMHTFPKTKFLIWTGAAQVKSQISKEEADRAKAFFTWVTGEWDKRDDNIFIWDFYKLQVNEGLYFPDSCAISVTDSHPGIDFAEFSGKLFANRVLDVVNNNGAGTNNVGENLH